MVEFGACDCCVCMCVSAELCYKRGIGAVNKYLGMVFSSAL